MDFILISAAFLTALIGAIGNTWDTSKVGFKKLRPVGWLAISVALVTAVFSFWKTIEDDKEKERLRTQISQTATDALIILTQELSDKGASTYLTPRLTLFAATTVKESEISHKRYDGSYAQLIRHLFGDKVKVKNINLKVDFFSQAMIGDVYIDISNFEPKVRKDSIEMAFVSTIDEPTDGPLAFSLVLEADKDYKTVDLVRDAFEKKGIIEVNILFESSMPDDELLLAAKNKLQRGFGYFSLSSLPVARLRFSLEPSLPIIDRSKTGRHLKLKWKIGVVEGIKT